MNTEYMAGERTRERPGESGFYRFATIPYRARNAASPQEEKPRHYPNWEEPDPLDLPFFADKEHFSPDGRIAGYFLWPEEI